jgi:hypothetical protein
MRSFKLRLGTEAFAMASTLLLAVACSASSNSSGAAHNNSNDSSNGGTGSTSATGSQPGYVASDASNANGGSSSGDGQVVPCTNGDDCICPTLTVAVIGTRGQWGASSNPNGEDPDTAFQDWLNSSSAGTARADNYTTKPTLTPDFLAGYNVIIFAGAGDNSNVGPWWKYDQAEVDAVADWVTNKKGGLITLTGYTGDPGEVDAKNALLAFSGVAYNKDGVIPLCTLVDATNNELCWCSGGNARPVIDWNRTDPVVDKLSLGVTMIGLDNGHSINAPANAHVAATATAKNNDGTTTTYNVMVGEIVGEGRVLAYSDEWITYTSEWNGAGNQNTNNPACQGYLPQERYQTAQLWYNMIRWTQPNATCFKIVDKQQPVNVW